MIVDINAEIKSRARLPHNLFMLNLAVFHLLMTPAIIALNMGEKAMLIPLALSLCVIAYTRIQSRKPHEHWFIDAHWQLAFAHCRLLLISYILTAALLGLGWLLSVNSADPHMVAILETVFLRISIMPVLLIVMANFYLESNALQMVGNSEIPDKYARLENKTKDNT